MLCGKEIARDINGLRLNKVSVVWNKLRMPGMSNRQRDIVWMTYQNVLPVRVVQKQRDLVRYEVCPRDGCYGSESVLH